MAKIEDYCAADWHSWIYHDGWWRKCGNCGSLRNFRTGEIRLSDHLIRYVRARTLREGVPCN